MTCELELSHVFAGEHRRSGTSEGTRVELQGSLRPQGLWSHTTSLPNRGLFLALFL